MIKNKVAQVVYQTAYCVLALIGVMASLGYFEQKFNKNFYVYYTNLSNYICAVYMFVLLVDSIKSANRKKSGFCDVAPVFNFLCVIMIIVTFLVYNILLAKEHTVKEYFTSVSNMTLHVVLPIMFILNWVLFGEHGRLRFYHPVCCMVMPLCYVCFIVFRALRLGDNLDPEKVIYPYFFLDINKLGLNGFLGWISFLFVFFMFVGYIFYFVDRKI